MREKVEKSEVFAVLKMWIVIFCNLIPCSLQWLPLFWRKMSPLSSGYKSSDFYPEDGGHGLLFIELLFKTLS
jgi:hypothetical protein